MKVSRWVIGFCALALLVTSWADAQVYIRQGQLSQSWSCSLAGLAASLTECKAIPATASARYYITDVVVGTTTSTSGSYAIQSGTGTNCATGTTALFPVNSTSARFLAPVVANASAMIALTTPIQATAGHAICVIGTTTNTINIQISGFMQ